MKHQNPEVRALAEAAALHLYAQPTAITLTMKLRADGRRNDHMTASANFRHFMNRLNSKVLGSAAKRYGKRLRVFPVIESNAEGRLHFHAVIDRPLGLALDKFTAVIKEQWSRTDFGYHEVDVQDLTSDGWLSYILKSSQKGGLLLDAIDWNNCTSIPG